MGRNGLHSLVTAFHHCWGGDEIESTGRFRQHLIELTAREGAPKAIEGLKCLVDFRNSADHGSFDDVGRLSRRSVRAQSAGGAFDRVIRPIQWGADQQNNRFAFGFGSSKAIVDCEPSLRRCDLLERCDTSGSFQP